jgi:hypothetical protein
MLTTKTQLEPEPYWVPICNAYSLLHHRIANTLVRKGYIKGIIGMPTNLFYGTGIPACIVVVDKEGSRETRPSPGLRATGRKRWW